MRIHSHTLLFGTHTFVNTYYKNTQNQAYIGQEYVTLDCVLVCNY